MLQIVVTRRPQFNYNNGWTPGVVIGNMIDNSGRVIVSTPMDGLLYLYQVRLIYVSAHELVPLLIALKEEK